MSEPPGGGRSRSTRKTNPLDASANATADRRSIDSLVERCLAQHLSPITARSTLMHACKQLGVPPSGLDGLEEATVLAVFDRALSLYLTGIKKQLTLAAIRLALRARPAPAEDDLGNVVVVLKGEGDATLARATALRMASSVLPKPDAVRVSTVTSELARNILQYAGIGKIEICLLRDGRSGVRVIASDNGPGIPNIDQILAGNYRSRTGMGLGLAGSKRLMDEFSVVTGVGMGTTVTAIKYG